MYIYKRVAAVFLEVYDKKVHSHHYVISQYVILNNKLYIFFYSEGLQTPRRSE